MKYIFWILLLATLLPSCNKIQEEKNLSLSASPGSLGYSAFRVESNQDLPIENSPSSPPESRVVSQTDKKIIRNASLRYQVKNIKESTDGIEEIIKKSGAYIASSNEQNSSYSIQTTMKIRVKSNRFDELVNALLQGAVYVDRKSITAEDVTTQFIDTEARLKAKKELEKRYMELLKQAKSVEEILQIENQLSAVREEVEAKEGVLRYLSDQVSYSTINLEFYESIQGQIQPQDSFFSKVLQGIQKGWYLLLDFVVGIFYIWPFVLLLLIMSYVVRKWRRRKKEKI